MKRKSPPKIAVEWAWGRILHDRHGYMLELRVGGRKREWGVVGYYGTLRDALGGALEKALLHHQEDVGGLEDLKAFVEGLFRDITGVAQNGPKEALNRR